MRFDEHHEVFDFQISGTGPTETVVAAVAGKAIRVLSYVLSEPVGEVLKWQSKPAGSAVELSGLGLAMPSSSPDTIEAPHNPTGWLQTASGSALQIVAGNTVQLGGHGTYILI